MHESDTTEIRRTRRLRRPALIAVIALVIVCWS
jgi:hypothetical protein